MKIVNKLNSTHALIKINKIIKTHTRTNKIYTKYLARPVQKNVLFAAAKKGEKA